MISDISPLLTRYVATNRSTYDRVGHKALRRLWGGGPCEADVRRDDVARPTSDMLIRPDEIAESVIWHRAASAAGTNGCPAGAENHAGCAKTHVGATRL